MRMIGVTLLAMSMMASSAFADPLPPGKPAGIQQAKIGTSGIVVVSLIAAVAVGVGIAVATRGSVPSGTVAFSTQ